MPATLDSSDVLALSSRTHLHELKDVFQLEVGQRRASVTRRW
jgi:hypothetical protein